MTYEDILPFLETHPQAVMVTFRRNGAAQMSIVTCGPYQGGVAFTTTAGRAKLTNLLRDPRCTIMVAKPDWRGYVVLEGTAYVKSTDRTDHEELRLALRDVYRAASGRDHPDWDDYDRAMVHDKRAAIIVRSDKVYGMGI